MLAGAVMFSGGKSPGGRGLPVGRLQFPLMTPVGRLQFPLLVLVGIQLLGILVEVQSPLTTPVGPLQFPMPIPETRPQRVLSATTPVVTVEYCMMDISRMFEYVFWLMRTIVSVSRHVREIERVVVVFVV